MLCNTENPFKTSFKRLRLKQFAVHSRAGRVVTLECFTGQWLVSSHHDADQSLPCEYKNCSSEIRAQSLQAFNTQREAVTREPIRKGAFRSSTDSLLGAIQDVK